LRFYYDKSIKGSLDKVKHKFRLKNKEKRKKIKEKRKKIKEKRKKIKGKGRKIKKLVCHFYEDRNLFGRKNSFL